MRLMHYWILLPVSKTGKDAKMSKKLILPIDVQMFLNKQSDSVIGRKNIYICNTCSRKVVTRDNDKGVTPFSILCRAKNGCEGLMYSSFYQCDQSLTPQFEWYRPETREEAGENIGHVMMGGLILRKVQDGEGCEGD